MRIAVIGDDGVGKSTLITCLFKDRYVPNIEDVLPPLTFPRTNGSLVTVVDTSPSLQKRDKLLAELRQANCIWLIFSDHYTMERISLFWLPFLRNSGVNLPVILCQNKQDQLFADSEHGSPETDASVEEEEDVIQLMQDFKEIESFVRCSAKLKRNVNEAFYLCQRAITYPLAPLFDSKQGQLKPLTVEALKRIFFLCDDDQSEVLTVDKMQRLQILVFQSPLDDDEIGLIRETLLNLQTVEDSNGSNRSTSPYHGILYHAYTDENKEGITVLGFLTLAQLYCERGRHETIWAILRYFHYTDSLSLDWKFMSPQITVGPLSHAELSPNGYQFLVDLFTLFDKDNDGGLSPQEIDTLFTPTPGLPPLWIQTHFPYSTLRNEGGYVTLQGWLAQWSMFVHLDHASALAYIAMLGYLSRTRQTDLKTALRVTKPAKKRNRRSKIYRSSTVQDRQVFHCLVFGDRGTGKSTLLSSFLERPLIGTTRVNDTNGDNNSIKGEHSEYVNSEKEGHKDPKKLTTPHTATSGKGSVAVNSVEMPGGKQCYLILQELSVSGDSVGSLDQCDVACLAYDSSDPDSFAHLVELRNNHKELDDVPLVFAALKADQDRVQQRCTEQPDDYTSHLDIAAPMHVSSQWPSSLSALFVQLVDAAMHPGQATVCLPEDEVETSFVPELVLAGGVAVAATVAWWIYRLRDK